MTKVIIGETEIELLPVKGRVVKKARKMMMRIGTFETEKEQSIAVDEYFDYIDEMAAEIAGKTVEELDDMDDSDKEKITSLISGRMMNQLDFLKSSSPQRNS